MEKSLLSKIATGEEIKLAPEDLPKVCTKEDVAGILSAISGNATVKFLSIDQFPDPSALFKCVAAHASLTHFFLSTSAFLTTFHS